MIQIIEATSDDVLGIREVSRITWLATYPNKEHKITKEDIHKRYALTSAELKKYQQERGRTVNTDPNFHTWIAKDGEKIVGFCRAQKGQEKRINALYVLPYYQGRSIGTDLLTVAMKWIGPGDIFVNVASYNHKAVHFYEKAGFIKTGKEFTEEQYRLSSGAIIPEVEMKKG